MVILSECQSHAEVSGVRSSVPTEQHALLLPGRVPGYSRDDVKLTKQFSNPEGCELSREAEVKCGGGSSGAPQDSAV